MSDLFLSIGECMVEMAPEPNGLFRRGFAGDTLNTAWYARRALPDTWRVGYLSAAGDDAISSAMVDFMQREGIETGAIRRIEGRTVGLYMIDTEDGERSFSYWRGQSAARCLADDAAWLSAQLQDARAIWFSGITLAILDQAARERLCKGIAAARASGAQVFFDTNLRPRLWDSRETMQAGILAGAAVADCVLPSFDEEEWLWGDMAPADTIARYANAGAGIVAVKNGGDPVTVWSQEAGQTLTLDTPKAERIVDSTAAGDSFGAAFAARLLMGGSPEQAVQDGAALAAKVIGAPGALVQ